MRKFRALSEHTTSAPSRSLLKCLIERCENRLSFKAGAIDLAKNDPLELICVGAGRSHQMKCARPGEASLIPDRRIDCEVDWSAREVCA